MSKDSDKTRDFVWDGGDPAVEARQMLILTVAERARHARTMARVAPVNVAHGSTYYLEQAFLWDKFLEILDPPDDGHEHAWEWSLKTEGVEFCRAEDCTAKRRGVRP